MNEENTSPADSTPEPDPRDKQIEELTERIKKLEAAGTEPQPPQYKPERHEVRRRRQREQHSTFWGIALIAFGGYWIMRELHWFQFDIPIWPSILVIVGLYILLTGGRDHDDE